MTLLNVFINNILPILLLGSAGFTLGKAVKLDSRPLARVIFNILSPVLIFDLLTSSKLAIASIIRMMGFSALVMVTVTVISFLIGKLLHLQRTVLIAVVITSFFANNGNYGLPLISFAFGQEALAYASVYFVTNCLLLYTLGVLIASLGQLHWKEALKGLLKVPAIYAILIAIIFLQTGWSLPAPIQKTVDLTAGGAVPTMIILLGLELQKVEWSRNLPAMSIPVICRLLLGPIIGLVAVGLFGLTGSSRQAGVTQAGMPSAVLTTVLAAEYQLEPSLVTAIVFISTILSPLTLTLLLYFVSR
jgi:predicted permease